MVFNLLVNEHNHGKSPCLMGKSTISGHFQKLLEILKLPEDNTPQRCYRYISRYTERERASERERERGRYKYDDAGDDGDGDGDGGDWYGHGYDDGDGGGDGHGHGHAHGYGDGDGDGDDCCFISACVSPLFCFSGVATNHSK